MGRCPGKHPRTKSGRLKSDKTLLFYMFPHIKLQGDRDTVRDLKGKMSANVH